MKKEKTAIKLEEEFGWDIRNFTITNEILFLSSKFSSFSERASFLKNGDFDEAASNAEAFSTGYFSALNEGAEVEQRSLAFENHDADISRGKIMVGNAQKTYLKIGLFDPFSPGDFKAIHASFNANILNRAGNYRNKAETVLHGKECIFTPPSAKNVPILIRELFLWGKENEGKFPAVVLSAIIHFGIVMIHPFTDGNCQIAKYWQESYMACKGIKMSFSRFEKALYEKQEDYYSNIGESRKERDASRFVSFVLRTFCEVAEEELKEKEGLAIADKYVKKLMEKTLVGFSYTAHELLKLLGLRSKETLKRHYLGPALENGFFAYSKNEKRTSKNQSYIRK